MKCKENLCGVFLFVLYAFYIYFGYFITWQDCWQCIAKVTKLRIGVYTGHLGMDTVKGKSFRKTPLLRFITVPHLVVDLSDSEANRNGDSSESRSYSPSQCDWYVRLAFHVIDLQTCISSCTCQNIGTQCGHNLWKLSGHPESICTWSKNRKNESP